MDNNRKKIINTIVNMIPPHINASDYISDTLNIGKEASYRRLRGKMSFSLEELITLSRKMGLSLDEFIEPKKENNSNAIELIDHNNYKDAFLSSLKEFRKKIDIRLQHENSETILALNYLPIEFSIHYKSIFKFSYYVWLHRRSKNMARLRYADIDITPEMELIRKNLIKDYADIKNITFILDPNVFLSPINEIRYFSKLKLINNDELSVIKDDFYSMINTLERVIRTEGSKYHFYISDLNIDTNSFYGIYNGNMMLSFNIQPLKKIVTTHAEICDAHKEWLDSLKRYSTLITESNEIAQSEYLRKQREFIDNL